MKVFVYAKSDSRKLAELKDVEMVRHKNNDVVLSMQDGIEVHFGPKTVKTTSYQN